MPSLSTFDTKSHANAFNSSVHELLHRVMGMFDADSNALIDIGPHATQAFVVYSETQLMDLASNSVMG